MLDENGKPVSLPNGGEESAAARVLYLDTIVEAGVQLTHWWAFHSDRVSFNYDKDSWGVRVDDETASTFTAIKAANESLQARYKVNPIAAENTTVLGDALAAARAAETETSADTDAASQTDVLPVEQNSSIVLIAVVALVMLAGVVCAVVVLRKKKK